MEHWHGPLRPYHSELIKIADRLAEEPDQAEADYLRRFRTIYRHLAASVVGVSIESGLGAATGMMPPGFAPPNSGELLDKTERELDGLSG
jgi:hypothetical protein